MWGGIAALAAIAAVLFWLLRGHKSASTRSTNLADSEVDHDELEAAEEEIREVDSGAQPGDEQPGDDWGPGTAKR